MSKKAAAPPSGSFRQTFSELLKARHPVLLIESYEEDRVVEEAAFGFPTDLAVHDGNLYILDEGSRPRVRKVDKAGIITTVGGQR